MSRLPWILLSNLLLSQTLEAYKALVVIPIPSISHSILGDSLVKLIADAGNEVTYITSYPHKNPPAGVREISVLDESDKNVWTDGLDLTAVLERKVNFNNMMGFIMMLDNLSLHVLQNDSVQKLMNDPNEKFDVIIADWLYNDIYAGLAPLFNCPFIWLSTTEHHWKILRTVDDIPNPAYTAEVVSANQTPFTFFQRVQELWFQIYGLLMDYFYTIDLQKTQYDNLIAPNIRKRGLAVPQYEEIRFNVSLVLGNSHVSLGSASSLPLNYKELAGYHIPKNAKPLTGDLKNLLDNATHGVIYFSLGSNLKSESFPENLKRSLLKMFGALKQTVLWKFGEDIPDKPSNVHILKWAPQHSILAHPNCILFITHGGFLSMIEAVHFGKPVIGIPVYGDQFRNVAKAVRKGYAIKVDLSYGMADDIKQAIQEIFTNPRYSAKAKELSFIYFHRPVSPAAELVHWVDHVVQTRGALHLRSPAPLLYWYQKQYLDLILFIILIIFGLKILIARLYVRMSRKEIRKKKKN